MLAHPLPVAFPNFSPTHHKDPHLETFIVKVVHIIEMNYLIENVDLMKGDPVVPPQRDDLTLHSHGFRDSLSSLLHRSESGGSRAIRTDRLIVFNRFGDY